MKVKTVKAGEFDRQKMVLTLSVTDSLGRDKQIDLPVANEAVFVTWLLAILFPPDQNGPAHRAVAVSQLDFSLAKSPTALVTTVGLENLDLSFSLPARDLSEQERQTILAHLQAALELIGPASSTLEQSFGRAN